MRKYEQYVPNTRNRNFSCRVTEFLNQGLKCVTMENEIIRLSVAVDKGADIYELLHKPSDTELLLRTPMGLRTSGLVQPTTNLREGSFLDFYEGGWQELLPSAGDFSCEHNGAQLGMHGEVALLPWNHQIIENTPERIQISFSVNTLRTPFHLTRVIDLERGRPTITIKETLVNTCDEDVQFMWGHHPCFGWPFLDENCVIELPDCVVEILASEIPPGSRLIPQKSAWPMVSDFAGKRVDLSLMPAPETRAQDMAFLSGFNEGWYKIKSRNSGITFRLAWDANVFPYLWFWQVTRGGPGYPWYGQTYCLAIEPQSSFPPMLPTAIKHETALRLPRHGSISTELVAELLAN